MTLVSLLAVGGSLAGSFLCFLDGCVYVADAYKIYWTSCLKGSLSKKMVMCLVEAIDLFGKVRDEWIQNDLATRIGANRFYPGVPDALKFAGSQVYIVTTKQGRFADALLRELASHLTT